MPLNLYELKQIVGFAFIMAAIDGDLDPREIETIEDFTEEHWHPEWGDSEEFLNAIDHDILEFFLPKQGREGIEAFRKDFLKVYQQDMIPENHQLLLELMEKVMKADGVIDENETALLKMLREETVFENS